ncbi:MAG: transposase [Acidaminococcaceae bacterium]
MQHFGELIIGNAIKMKAEGKTSQEISNFCQFKNNAVIEELVKRFNRKQKMIAAGITTIRKGRPAKSSIPTIVGKDNEIRRLEMENELLRSFFQIAGRKRSLQ